MTQATSTARLAALSSRRPWTVIAVWAVVLAGALGLTGAFLSDALTTESNFLGNPESKLGTQVLDAHFPEQEGQESEAVILKSATLVASDPEFQAKARDLVARVGGLARQADAPAFPVGQSGEPDFLVSRDGHALLFPVKADDLAVPIEELRDAVHSASEPGRFEALVVGPESLGSDYEAIAEEDLKSGEGIGLIAAGVILLIVFGTLVATSLPVILALVSIAVALGAAALVGQVFELSFFVTNMVTMIGLAVGIDYSLFIVSRYREERRRGLSPREATITAAATSGRAVLFSGTVVVFALVGMLFVPETTFRSLGTGAILVVIAALAASLTLLPAVLVLLGDKVDAVRIPFVHRAGAGSATGFWTRATGLVTRHATLSLVASVALLGAAAWPYLDIQTGAQGLSGLPAEIESRRGFEVLQRDFGIGLEWPVIVAIEADADARDVQAAVAQLVAEAEALPEFGRAEVATSEDREAVKVTIPVNIDPLSRQATDAVRTVRDDIVPTAFSGVSAEVFVTGETAGNLDFAEIAATSMPRVVGFVLALSFILLMVVFRSIVVPLKAMAMNLLSVGAAYGLIVLVFQKGAGAGLLGFQQAEVVSAWIPLFLFSVLFGLSMDYHVFLLSRVREEYDRTGDNDAAVAHGVSRTAGLITGAALIMVAVFAGFASGRLVEFQQMGFGLAVAVLLDATIVRSILVPASMKLLGKWNWYLPRFLDWLPAVRVEGPVERAHATAPISAD